ncbi:MAG: hypothetical protein HFG73_01800 [Hungatella sp.]|nr:hypothetical protein [Hungatella sp.]
MNISYTIDGHFDMLTDVCRRRRQGEHQVIRRRFYPAFASGHVTGVVASIFVDSCHLPYGAMEQAMEQVGALHCEIEESPDILMLCTCAADFQTAADTGRVGILMSFEGAEPVSSCMVLHSFYAAGVRGLGLAWSRRNQAADGCDFSGNLKKGGLTPFGLNLVREAETLSMFIDVSHLSDEGVEDVLNHTCCPIAATHSDARAVAYSNRNLTDGQMAEIARRGGIAGLNGCSIIASQVKEEACSEKLLDHLDHMIDVMGDGHVGFGFDFCDPFLTDMSPRDLALMPYPSFDLVGGHAALPDFLRKMAAHGYSRERIRKIAGENWLEFFRRRKL